MAPRVVIVGGGFAGAAVARRLERHCGVGVHLVCPDDYMLYLPLLPQVASGVLPVRAAVVSLTRRLRRTHLVPGRAIGVDLDRRRVVVDGIAGNRQIVGYDRLVLAPGSVTRVPDVPGLREFGHGCKTLAEAEYLRDHIIAQLEIAAAARDPAETARRARFVVVGGGYAGVETAAHLQLMTRAVAARIRGLDPARVRWHVVQHADELMPGLDPALGAHAHATLRERGVCVDLRTGLDRVDDGVVTLSDGRRLETHTLIWTAGVTPSPLVQHLDAPTDHGRLIVGDDLAVPGRPEVFALGDAAAAPDIVGGGTCPPTAQHAIRQAPVVADNLVAGLTGGTPRRYRHRDLGLVADLGGRDAVASPLGVDLSGLPAQLVSRGYHLWALRTPNAIARVVANWTLHGLSEDNTVRLGFAGQTSGRLAEFEHTDLYLTPAQAREATGRAPAPQAPDRTPARLLR